MNRVMLLWWVVVGLAVSCSTPKDIAYFQDVRDYAKSRINMPYDVFIHQDDLLAIMVNSRVPEAVLPFNLPIASYYVGSEVLTGQQRLLGFLVDKAGNIDYPLLGQMHVEGLSRIQLRDKIKDMLISEGFVKDPIVTVNFLNFKVSVQGEVNRPGTFNVVGERITLLEALSMAGDLTIFGRRDRVMVIREEKGERIILRHDLTSLDLFTSPCYYLQQNDIVYVEPNRRRIQQSNINQNNNANIWLSVVSILLTTVSMFIALTK